MANYYITINRQFGSLGLPIAIKLAEILGIEYYDRDIVEETARQMNIPLSQASEQEETVANRFGRMAFPLGQGSTENQQQMFDVQAKIIQDLAAKGPPSLWAATPTMSCRTTTVCGYSSTFPRPNDT